jgi:hypothetical protein
MTFSGTVIARSFYDVAICWFETKNKLLGFIHEIATVMFSIALQTLPSKDGCNETKQIFYIPFIFPLKKVYLPTVNNITPKMIYNLYL